MTEDDLTRMLGRWSRGSGPLYKQLRDALLELLETGSLQTGTTLPPERKLAGALAVSRNTVAAAYAELRSMGWVDARQGSGTTITALRYSPVGGHRANGIFATLMRDHPDVVDLTIAVPEAAPIVTDVLAEPTKHIDRSLITQGHGYEPRGDESLRTALAETLTGNGLPTSPDQLLITTGAQQAISLLVRGLTRPGDAIGVEETSFPGAIDAISVSGARAVPINMTEAGLDPSHLEEVVRTERPRLLYLVPTFHNPTGTLLSGRDRRRVAGFVAEHQVTTVDDLTLAELDFGQPAPPPLAALEPDAPIISIGSMSKVFWGGLRIGWLRAKPNIISHLVGLKTAADLGTAAPMQRMAAAMLGHYETTREFRNEQLVTSLTRAMDALSRHLPDWTWVPPLGGPHLWLKVPDIDSPAFSHRLLQNGVAVVPGPLLTVDGQSARDHIRVPFYLPPATLELAIERMAQTYAGMRDADLQPMTT